MSACVVYVLLPGRTRLTVAFSVVLLFVPEALIPKVPGASSQFFHAILSVVADEFTDLYINGVEVEYRWVLLKVIMLL